MHACAAAVFARRLTTVSAWALLFIASLHIGAKGQECGRRETVVMMIMCRLPQSGSGASWLRQCSRCIALQLLQRYAAGAQHAQTPRAATHGLRNAVTTAHQGRLCRVGRRGMGEGRRPSPTGLGNV